MSRRPLAVTACCWIVGSGMAYLYNGSSLWLLCAGVSLLCPFLKLIGHCSWKQMLLLWLAFSLGAAYWVYNDGRNVSHIPEALYAGGATAKVEELAVFAEGTIVSAVDIDGDRADFTLALTTIRVNIPVESGQKATGREKGVAGERVMVQLRLASPEELGIAAKWGRGDHIKLAGSIASPATATNYGGFNYREYLHNKRIHWLFKAKGASALELTTGTFTTATFFGWIDDRRYGIGEIIGRLFPDWQAGFMKGLIIGLSDDLDQDKYDQFTGLGLTHILAISGSHVAINISLIFAVLRLCRVTRERALLIVFWFLPAYVLITGFSPSVIRSGIMSMLGVYLLRRGLLKDGLNVLSAAALVMLFWEPYFLLNVSFQLSFAVTAGLILFVPLLTPYFKWLPQKIRGAVAITVAAQIVSFPLTIYYFNQFSLLSIAANLFLVPVISVVTLPLGTAALLLGMVWLPLGQWITYPVRFLNSGTFMVTEWLNGLPGFMTYWKSPSLIWILSFYGVVYFLLYSMSRRNQLDLASTISALDDTVPLQPLQDHDNRRSTLDVNSRLVWGRVGLQVMLAGCTILLLLIGYQPVNSKGTGHVQFIDVGQGDCTLMTTPDGKNILVDGGGTVSFRKPGDSWRDRKDPYEVGAKTVVPLLKKRGIHTLDVVIMTHGDQDHVGGLQAVLEHFPVNSVIMNGSLTDSKTVTKLMSTAIAKDIPIYSVSRGMLLKPDERTTLEFLSPKPTENRTGEIPYIQEQNHESVVFRLQMDGSSFLFTGDMDEAAELKVIEIDNQTPSPPQDHNIDVLKVAHHGSKTSSSQAWLTYWNPVMAVISVGASNSYGHPYPAVVERLLGQGTDILRTDQNGEIQMEVKAGELRVRHMFR
ncbi:DNA internalization-related competence protein ComEC/Rec2 [Paenibacillus segetis]|uniref:DNA internalization-related competence protein ComEC/Rec2 n=1 Tax=Paenibacillus segetis TaxID=1325360 RepID=A0ABQ1YJR7_9BACL|nr:DNA internalization-related competence protein ComEC/Rec2 [Paenibacillus segetis]GGH28050.1 DNA internalization-related competence protein ComEC/Rec2 [Paenibacillus segetis]